MDIDVIDYEIRPAKKASLLSKSIEQLKLELTTEIIKKCKENAARLREADNDDYDLFQKGNNGEVNLWVEKFKPKDFFELLSDDSINRLLLTWMKSWDYCVFGKEVNKDKIKKHNENQAAAVQQNPTEKNKNQINNNNNQNALNLSSKKRKRDFLQNDIETEEKLLELDENNRPKIKVALISGPPGLGKTTLAHIIAKRAGYNCIEMNASDDRSADAFKQSIESVTEIRGTVNDSSMKPNCLIIDEIDGAPANAIQVLIDHINETVKTKKKGARSHSIMRPIICICNDLYTPSLKQLRQVAIVFQCPKVQVHRLAERLGAICAMTNMAADTDGLIALCDKTNNDIRSCLNTLQFLSKQNNQRITAKLVNQLNIGQKDQEKGLFTVLNEVFSIGSNVKKLVTASKAGDDQLSGAAASALNSFDSTLNSCQSVDLDKLTQGIYENYLSLRFRDTNFETVMQANDWFMFSDQLNKQYRENQDYILYNYQKYLPMYFHLVFASSASQAANKRFKYPTTFGDLYMKQKKNSETLTHMLDEMTPSIRVMYNSVNFIALDLLPFLSEILHPSLRPVTIQLFSKSEKEKVDNLIKLMISFNLNYRQERTHDGQYSYMLEPPIDEIIKFNGLKQKKQLPYILKQQISREIGMEKVRMADRHKTQNAPTKQAEKKSTDEKQSQSQSQSQSSQTNNNNIDRPPFSAGSAFSPVPSIKKNLNATDRPSSPKFYASPLALKAAAMFKKVNKNTNMTDDLENMNKNQQQRTNMEITKTANKSKMPMNDMFRKFLKPSNKNTETITQSKEIDDSEMTKKQNAEYEAEVEHQQQLTNSVWLKYKEGFINAVRYPIKIRQLL